MEEEVEVLISVSKVTREEIRFAIYVSSELLDFTKTIIVKWGSHKFDRLEIEGVAHEEISRIIGQEAAQNIEWNYEAWR